MRGARVSRSSSFAPSPTCKKNTKNFRYDNQSPVTSVTLHKHHEISKRTHVYLLPNEKHTYIYLCSFTQPDITYPSICVVVTHLLVVISYATDWASPAHVIRAGLLRIEFRLRMGRRRFVYILSIFKTCGVTNTPLAPCNSVANAFTCIIASMQEIYKKNTKNIAAY